MVSSAIVPLATQNLPDNCFVFKHSTRCPISTAAADVVRRFDWPEKVCWINVVEQRELSDWVAAALGVKHESPQLIRVRDGAAAGVLTHGAIRDANIRGLEKTD